jgi:hypothetical protein
MFQQTPIYQLPGECPVFGLRIPYLPSAQDRILAVNGAMENRSDLLSSTYQGTPGLWWLMADLSVLPDPLTAFVPGALVRFSPAGLPT